MPENKTPAEDIYKKLGCYRIDELTDEDKKPPEFIIEGMVPVGLTFLSGVPKSRKSFMALQMADAVSKGEEFLKHKTLQCGVVYFDLEGSKNRIAARTEKMAESFSDKLLITNQGGIYLGDGTLIEAIKAVLEKDSGVRFIIIDTYSRARGNVRTGGANAYDVDVTLLAPLQQFAQEKRIAILCVHHDRKGAGNETDSMERLSGTMGISGSCDSILNLTLTNGQRADGQAKLEANPRDSPPFTADITFDGCCNQWRILQQQTANLCDEPLVAAIVRNAPQAGNDNFFFQYNRIYLAAYGVDHPDAGNIVRNVLSVYRKQLYEEYGIVMGIGAKSDGKRGVRLFREK